jgi:hypothetical protein
MLSGVLPAERAAGSKVFLCVFERDERRSWLGLDEAAEPVTDRGAVREAVSLLALCEIAEETAAGGQLEALRTQLLRLRLTEAPEGIEEAEAAALALEQTLATPPRIASAAYLDALGAAVRRLEQALGDPAQSPFATAMQAATGAAELLRADVEEHYKLPLS